jgi:hypothetical protein
MIAGGMIRAALSTVVNKSKMATSEGYVFGAIRTVISM